MKLSDIEIGQLKLLYDKGFRFICRDDCVGLCAFRVKPRLCVSHNPGIKFRFWSATEGVLFLHDDYFKGVGFHEIEPYRITKTFKLKLCNPTKKVVNV